MMKEFIQRIIDIYPLYTKRIALFERHLEARENRDMRDALTMLKIKIGLVDSLITLLEPDERFVFRQILQNSGDVSPAQQAAAIRWMWSFSQRDETFWALYERAMMRIANFMDAHKSLIYEVFSDLEQLVLLFQRQMQYSFCSAR